MNQEGPQWDAHVVGGQFDMFPDANRNPGYQFGLDANNLGSWLDYHHNLLSETHSDTTAASPVRGDVITAQGATPKWTRLARSVPAANVRNALGLDNGDTEPAWKTTLDSTAPTTIAEGAVAAAGTSLIYSHRDHTHGAPATYAATAHNLLSATHGDTLADSVVRGDVVYGNATPKWARLAKPATPAVLYNDATDVAWDTLAWTSVTFDSANFTASAGNWTLASGDQTTFAYRLIGKTMVVAFVLSTTTVSATPNSLAIKIPASKTAARQVVNPVLLLDNGARSIGYASVSGTSISIFRTDAANFAIATDTTYVWGEITFETT